ncbi:MAG: DUF4293 family protein [Flavobacteriales bacterium AspAUS03]
MLYRVQTIYISIVAFMSGLASRYSPFWLWDGNMGYDSLDHMDQVIVFLFAVIAVIAFLNIFLFKWRKLQIHINRLNVWLNLLLFALIFYLICTFPEEHHYFQKVINGLVPISSVIFLFVSNKAIQRDNALIKSINRIR